MRKILYLSITIFLFFSSVEAQQNISIDLREQPIDQLFLEIEKQTPYRIFCNPEETDSLIITIQAVQEKPLEILEKALQPTGLTLSVFNEHIFILKERILLTSLPEGYFDRTILSQDSDYDLSGFSLSLSRRDQKATSENKVYEIGDAPDNSAGRVTLTGSVIDFKTGEPMVGVALFISDPLIATTTDGFGYYSIQLPTGRHELQIKGMGMKDTKRQILLHSGGKLDIELEEQVYTLKEVTVSSERIENVRSTNMGVERLKMREIKNIPTAFGEADIIRVVMSLPGVKSVGEASSGFNVRGGATDQNLILFNDGVIYNPTHLFGFFSAFNPDVVKDMELYKSSIPSKYGGRISSVLDITTREGNKKEFQGSASIGLLTSRLTLEGPVFSEKTSFIVGGVVPPIRTGS
ncbi:MAG: TonB-dependent receptor [Tannerellaceae bacterium]|nr:TonB-dependent receptor [Tannerellaceae bacterium]